MADQEQKGDEKGCCTKGKCCGGAKALGAIGLLLIGGLSGFVAGRHCGKGCPVQGGASAQTPAK